MWDPRSVLMVVWFALSVGCCGLAIFLWRLGHPARGFVIMVASFAVIAAQLALEKVPSPWSEPVGALGAVLFGLGFLCQPLSPLRDAPDHRTRFRRLGITTSIGGGALFGLWIVDLVWLNSRMLPPDAAHWLYEAARGFMTACMLAKGLLTLRESHREVVPDTRS